MRNYNIRQAKLIIWDLDDTFWAGTLTEGNVKFDFKICDFVEQLVTRGIMNSVCSKNDFETVKAAFIDNGFKKIWDKFLFPSISWEAKGNRVKNIITKMQLREENVIFIDDNPMNIEEVKFYCPNIMTADQTEIQDMMNELYTVNAYDFEHTRLQQYKILEMKDEIKTEKFSSNEDFLKNSEIKIAINGDCDKNIDRIFELLKRTNQLNFTKKRLDLENLTADIKNPNYTSKYITVKDKYGSYGICGFYTLNNESNELVHFLFSCRIMGMGVEQFLYKYLNYPNIEIVGNVASDLKSMDPDWIEIVEHIDINPITKKNCEFEDTKILFKGTCDLLSSIDYINPNCKIDMELPYWNKNLVYILSHTHTAFIEQSNTKTPEEIQRMCSSFPYPPIEEFETKFFKNNYNLIFLSVLSDTFSGLYINKHNGDYVVFGYANCDITDETNWEGTLGNLTGPEREASLQQLKDFKENYVFAGDPPTKTTLKSLKYIRETLPKETELVLFLGSEIHTDKFIRGYEGMAPRHVELNRAIEEFAKDYKNIAIVNFTDFITSDDDYTACINHFTREVYAKIAQKIVEIANEKLHKKCLEYKALDEIPSNLLLY